MTLKVTFDIPEFKVNKSVLREQVDRLGPKLATKTRRALKQGTDYDGDTFPVSSTTGAPIDLHETGALIKSVKYSRRLKEIAPTGPHPEASTRAGGAYGLAQILMSGKDRTGNQVRDEFDIFGDREQILKDAADLLEDALNALSPQDADKLIG